ncbi:MAG: hypothetical protein ACQCN4_12080 [Candidatus Bathyarchaeia archaeon]|jgi:hypothetical protein
MVVESWTHKIIWRTQKDDDVCPTCKALDGYTWSIGIDEPYPKQLIHPIFGPVFDNRPAADCSLVKEEKGHCCRCTLEHQFDISAKPVESAVSGKVDSKRACDLLEKEAP